MLIMIWLIIFCNGKEMWICVFYIFIWCLNLFYFILRICKKCPIVSRDGCFSIFICNNVVSYFFPVSTILYVESKFSPRQFILQMSFLILQQLE